MRKNYLMQEGRNRELTSIRLAKYGFWILIALLCLFGLYLVKGALFAFVIGLVLTYVLHPFVKFFEKCMPFSDRRPRLSRSISISMVFFIVLVVIGGYLFVVVPPLFKQTTELLNSLPTFITGARATVESWNQEYASNIPEEIRLEIDRGLENAGSILVGAFRGLLNKTAVAAVHALTLVVGLVVVPLFVFYLLKDHEKLRESFIDTFPADSQIHVVHIMRILNRIIGAYVRAQVTLAAFVWVVISLGLSILGIDFAILLGAVAGLFEFVPIIGAWLGVIPAIVIVLSTSPDKIIFVLALYLVVQLFQGAVLVPRIHSHSLKVHPVLILVSIVIGSEIGGMWGVVLGPPLVAAFKELFVYFSNPASHNEIISDAVIKDENELENSVKEI